MTRPAEGRRFGGGREQGETLEQLTAVVTPQVLPFPPVGDVVPWRSWQDRGEGKGRQGALPSFLNTMTFRLSLETTEGWRRGSGLPRRARGLFCCSPAGQVRSLLCPWVLAGKQLSFCS